MSRFNQRVLKSLRLKFGWSMDVTATNLGISKTWYAHYERGEVNYGKGGFDDTSLSAHQLLGRMADLFQLQGPDALLLPDPVCRFGVPSTPELFGRQPQLELLHAALKDKSLNLCVIVGFGGQGKTELVRHWLRDVAHPKRWRGLPIFEWSFPRQGEQDGRPLSADFFFNALAHGLGLAGLIALGAREKADRLAGYLRDEPVLLFLDGLEPLQRSDREPLGLVNDAALLQFLEALSLANAGLCVVTSRIPLAGLGGAEGHGIKTIVLPPLSPAAGQQLLRSLGVEGLDKELQDASEELHGNAFGLQLLAKLLKPLTGSRFISQRLLIRHPSASALVLKDRLLQLIQDYEHWILSRDGIEINLLEVISIFDEPVSTDAMNVLFLDAGIPDLTARWSGSALLRHQGIDALRNVGLILPANVHRNQELEIHPLVRAYFRQRLLERNPSGLREAHSRLFDFYSEALEQRIETWEQFKLCLTVMTHGIRAERYLESLWIAHSRLVQEGSIIDILRFGSLHACIECLSYCFDEPWNKINQTIPLQIQREILIWSGLAVYTSGQVENGAMLFQQALNIMNLDETTQDPLSACVLLVVLGECQFCLGHMQHLDKMASRCDDIRARFDPTSLGYILLQLASWFLKAQAAQGRGQPERAERAITECFRHFRRAWEHFGEEMGVFFRRNIHIVLTIGYQSCEALSDCSRFKELEGISTEILAIAESMHCPRVIREVMLLPVLRTRLELSLQGSGLPVSSDALIRAMGEGLEFLRATDALLPLLRSLLNLVRALLMQTRVEKLALAETLLREANHLIQRESLVCFQIEYEVLYLWLACVKASLPSLQSEQKLLLRVEIEQQRLKTHELMERSGFRRFQGLLSHIERRFGAQAFFSRQSEAHVS